MAQHKNQYIPSLAESDNLHQIHQKYRIINNILDDLNTKVDKVIQQHQAQFLIAYRNHVKMIKSQLRQLKDKADQQQNKINDNNRMYYLEKQICIFRQQALKLYDKLQQKAQQTQVYRARVKDLQKNTVVQQVQLKELIKNTKILQAKLYNCQQRNNLLQQLIKQKQKLIHEFSLKSTKHNTKSVSNYIKSNQHQTVNNSKQYKQYKISKKKFSNSKGQDNQLKDWFIQCVKTIKKDVAYRKNSGYQLQLEGIKSIQQFKMVDKLRLLQKFMQNQKLLTWMYQKIFPSRMQEIRQYLSHKSISHVQVNKQTSQPQKLQLVEGFYDEIFDRDKDRQRIQVLLPKMSSTKARNSQIRNKVNIKYGKLNISAV